LDFVITAANLRAYNYGLKGESEKAYFKKVLATVMVPEFVPKSGVKIQVNENENTNEGQSGRC
jgi:ubiquitin-activating enzyme E1